MAWWNDYDRGYRGYGYGFGYDRGYYAGDWSRGYYGPGTAGWADYDRTYRVAPERSPTYGRRADEAARRFARSHGYDAGYAIDPQPSRGYGTRDRTRMGYTGTGYADYDRGYRGAGAFARSNRYGRSYRF